MSNFAEVRTNRGLPRRVLATTGRKNTGPSRFDPSADAGSSKRVTDRKGDKASECKRSDAGIAASSWTQDLGGVVGPALAKSGTEELTSKQLRL